MKIIVLGANGNLGRELVRVGKAAGHAVAALSHDDLDVTDETAVRLRIFESDADVIMNAVAYNDVDGAEAQGNNDRCSMLNATVPGMLARVARDRGIALVHFSTDYVFGGEKSEGYVEDDPQGPLSLYGHSKWMGEQAVQRAGGRAYIVRTSKLFGPAGKSRNTKPSFVATMLRLAKEKPELAIVDDEIGCPTFTTDLAEASINLVAEAHPPDTYHLVNEGPGVTWYGFAEEIFGTAGVTTPRKAVPATPRPAARPKSAILINTKFPPLRPRIDALRAFLAAHPDGR